MRDSPSCWPTVELVHWKTEDGRELRVFSDRPGFVSYELTLRSGWRRRVGFVHQDGRLVHWHDETTFPRAELAEIPTLGIPDDLFKETGVNTIARFVLGVVRDGDGCPLSTYDGPACIGLPEHLDLKKKGRRGYSDRFYAFIALLYVQQVEKGNRSPNVWIAKWMNTHVARTPSEHTSAVAVEEWIKRARARELLTRTTEPGSPGGELTQPALDLVGKFGR